MKKPEILSPFARIFTRTDADAYDAIPFQSSDTFGDESAPALASPVGCSAEAVALIAEGSACASIPADLRAVEENTVPSWLWVHRGHGKHRQAEGDLRAIIDRVVGAAIAKAWKLGLFVAEKNARAFYDEARFALMQSHIALAPELMAGMGLDWAYGINAAAPRLQAQKTPTADLTNAAIDALTGKEKDAATIGVWKKLFAASGKEKTSIDLRLSDIAADWQSANGNPARAALDLMALRHNDGSINIDALRQAVRVAVTLLDLHDLPDVTLGFANLAPLLLALGLAYDSDAGRAMAASLAALVTAECYACSAEMAALRGASETFTTNRENIMRIVRNHRRAVYGDHNDYEKLSVLPAPLPLKNCPDLALAAAAQHRWDQALDMAHAFGLRAVRMTDMTPSPVLTLLMQSAAQGLEPMTRLTGLQSEEGEPARIVLHASVAEALERLDYAPRAVEELTRFVAGAHTLRKAPHINAASLAAKGIDAPALEKIESYLPCVDTVRLAVTPWIVGIDTCRSILKISARTLESPRFDLLRHLGFTDADIAAADLYCYGHGTARAAKALHLRHRPLFACGTEVSAEARIRMAAAVQSFISGDTGLVATLPAQQSVTRGAEVTLSAWRKGLRSLTIVFDPTLAVKTATASTSRRIKAAPEAHAKAFAVPPRKAGGHKAKSTLAPKRDGEKRARSH